MKNKKNDKKYFIVSLFIVVLSLAIGYAIFAETINITGTAQTTGTFDVEFFDATVASSYEAGDVLNTAVIDGAKNLLTLTVPDLQRVGSYVNYDITVKNVGTIGAELISVDVTGDDDLDIVVTYPTWTTGIVLAPGATYTFPIRVEWINTSTTANHNITFTATLNYQQDF